MKLRIPELLAPAGNLEKLKVAVSYGAQAIYLGGEKFGLRSAADNFTLDELQEGVHFAHQRGVKIYVVLNSFLYDKDLEEMPPFLHFLEELGVDAVIVSDLGVLKLVRELTGIPIHLSTQASCLNREAAKLWKKMGVKRLVLGRETSIKEAFEIKKHSGLEVEQFIHGSMCMAYSGNCVISNFTMGRDSNRGGCAHNCRFEYKVDFPDDYSTKGFLMSSKDLMGIDQIPHFFEYGIDSLKIEGRMKTHLYVGTVVKTYQKALNEFARGTFRPEEYLFELQKITHRDYTSGSLEKRADATSIYNQREHEESEYFYVGQVLDTVEDKFTLVEVRSPFYQGDKLEILPFNGPNLSLLATPLRDILNDSVEKAHPGMLVKIPFVKGAKRHNLLRGKR